VDKKARLRCTRWIRGTTIPKLVTDIFSFMPNLKNICRLRINTWFVSNSVRQTRRIHPRMSAPGLQYLAINDSFPVYVDIDDSDDDGLKINTPLHLAFDYMSDLHLFIDLLDRSTGICSRLTTFEHGDGLASPSTSSISSALETRCPNLQRIILTYRRWSRFIENTPFTLSKSTVKLGLLSLEQESSGQHGFLRVREALVHVAQNTLSLRLVRFLGRSTTRNVREVVKWTKVA